MREEATAAEEAISAGRARLCLLTLKTEKGVNWLKTNF